MAELTLENNADQKRYEARLDGELAGFAEYIPSEGGRVVMPHTEVDPKFEGQGIGSKIMKFALDDLRARDLSVVPLCPFVASWIDRHPDYQNLLTPHS